MKLHENIAEHAFVCPACGYTAYPRISPAVIVLVTKGDKVLLQRNSHYKHGLWSLVAGYVDAGENLEDAVRREIDPFGFPARQSEFAEKLRKARRPPERELIPRVKSALMRFLQTGEVFAD